jgi:hypothetical protein
VENTVSRRQVSVNFFVFVDELETTCDLSHYIPNSDLFWVGFIYSAYCPDTFDILFQVPITELHVNEYVRHVRDFAMSQDLDNVFVGPITKFCHSPDLILHD